MSYATVHSWCTSTELDKEPVDFLEFMIYPVKCCQRAGNTIYTKTGRLWKEKLKNMEELLYSMVASWKIGRIFSISQYFL